LNAPSDRLPLPDEDDEDLVLALRRPLVAVLPFAPAGGDAALRLLGSELAGLLRERLAGVPALRAILISSEFLERAPEHALELICRQLHIGHLITGKCYRHPQGESLYVELTDTREWNVQWAQFCRGSARELLAPDSPGLVALQVALQEALLPAPSH
jgi:TolB-like protein